MKKHVGMIFILLGVILIFLVSGCAFLDGVVGKRHYETFVLEINGERVIVRLPEALPSMKNAKSKGEQCFNLLVCRRQFCLGDEADHDHVDFLYVGDGEVIALVWVRTKETDAAEKYSAWIYVDGVPVDADIFEVIELIKDKEVKKSGFGDGYLSLAGFAWEGELDPNKFDDWRLLSIRPLQGYFWVFIENPDPASPIEVVMLEVDLNSNVLGYRYFKHGEPHLYVFDVGRNEYVRYRFTREEKESCMECHGDESEKDTLHEDMKGA